MDLLASLQLDSLPEQQTRTSRPSVADALAANPNVRLGFDVCCNCAAENVSVQCKGCGRVSYCSSKCRKEDASPSQDDTQQHGHGSVVCALLRLCEKDEHVDEGGRCTEEDAEDRVRSEFESYPATLANILMDGPCYREALSKGKTASVADKNSTSSLTVHVVGASSGVELWGDRKNIKSCFLSDVFSAYAEALCALADEHKLQTIRLIFIGPDCPNANTKEVRKMSFRDESGATHKDGGSRVIAETHRSNYDTSYLKKGPPKCNGPPPAADIVVFFNPGFTCPDYKWDDALSCIQLGTPFLVTTNTEMEMVADLQFLFERGFIADLPPMIADILDGNEVPLVEDASLLKESGLFFGENPFAGSRVRQSGNMANDLFVKNRWMFGGILGKKHAVSSPEKSQKRLAATIDMHEKAKKRKSKAGSANSKKSNPALI